MSDATTCVWVAYEEKFYNRKKKWAKGTQTSEVMTYYAGKRVKNMEKVITLVKT